MIVGLTMESSRKNENDNLVLYQCRNVFSHAVDYGGSSLFNGTLRLIKKPIGVFVEWTPEPMEPTSSSRGVGDIGALTDSGTIVEATQPTFHVEESCSTAPHHLQISIDLKDLSGYKCSKTADRAYTLMQLILKDGTSFQQLRLCTQDYEKLVTVLEGLAELKRSLKEDNYILLTAVDKGKAFKQTLAELMKDTPPSLFTNFFNEPRTAVLTGLSKMTDVIQSLNLDFLNPDEIRHYGVHSLSDLQKRDEFDNDAGDSTFEMVFSLPERPEIERDHPMTTDEWHSFKNEDGRFHNVKALKQRVARGGLVPEIRPEAWAMLLGVYPWDSTKQERQAIRKNHAEYYDLLKSQWMAVTTDQETRWSLFRERKMLIERDATRTDRNHSFFEGENNENISMLYEILMAYLMYNFDLGYVQGMSDFLSPIMVVMQDEVESFWSFVSFLQKTHRNFEMDQSSIKHQLHDVKVLLCCVDRELGYYLESAEADNMFFTFRWLLVLFKREFSFDDIMVLWEVLWTDLPCKNFHLLICVAILIQEKNMIIENKFGFTEILKYVNNLSMNIDVNKILSIAEGIYHQLFSSQDQLPEEVQITLGFVNGHSTCSSGGSLYRNGDS